MCQKTPFYAMNVDAVVPNPRKLLTGSLSVKGYEVFWSAVEDIIKKVDTGVIKQHKHSVKDRVSGSQEPERNFHHETDFQQYQPPHQHYYQSWEPRPRAAFYTWKPHRFPRGGFYRNQQVRFNTRRHQ